MGGEEDKELFDLGKNPNLPSKINNHSGSGLPVKITTLQIHIVLVISVAVGILFSLVAMGLTLQGNRELSNEILQLRQSVELTLSDDRKKYNTNFQNIRKDILVVDDWFSATGEVYYKKFHQKLSYNRSKAECEKLGADLLAKAIRNVEEIQYMLDKGILIGNGHEDIWVGYSDAEEEDVWKWVDGGQTNKSTVKWVPGQPDNWKSGEHCAEFRRMNGTVILLNDALCDTDRFKFICERTV